MDARLLQVRGLTVEAVDSLGRAEVIVDDISFSVAAGQVTALIGESGSGKSTISLACLGYVRSGCRIAAGDIHIGDLDVLNLDEGQRRELRGTTVGYIAQNAATAFNPAITIGAQVIEIPVMRGLLSRAEAADRAIALYRQLDLPNPESIGRLYPHQVSGGQLQRLMAAMAMICQPKLLILDEPTTALDVTTQIEVLTTFKHLIRRHALAAIYISHDLAVVAQMADDVLVLRNGKAVEQAPITSILAAPQAAYTRRLIAAASLVPDTAVRRACSGQGREGIPLLAVEDVDAAYGKGRGPLVLRKVSLAIDRGQTIGVIGESGSGKSTLARVISGLMPPVSGRVLLDGEPLCERIAGRTNDQARRIQFAFQNADSALNPGRRIGRILARPIELFQGLKGSESEAAIVELLRLVELPEHFANRFPHELSGGQKQRVNLARALASKPDIVICDEITSALDTVVSEAIIRLLRDLRDRLELAYVFISHDLSLVANFADQLAVMRDGEVVDAGPTAEVLAPPHHDYTDLLIRSVPQLETDWLESVVGSDRASAGALVGRTTLHGAMSTR